MLNREFTYSLEGIDELASALLELLSDKRIICLKGPLGAGKTRLVEAVCRALGYDGPVSSPTFSLVNEYSYSRGVIYHFDLYRLNTMEEIIDLGFEEYIYSGNVCFIEWPEKVTDILPKELVLNWELTYLARDKRTLRISTLL